MNNAAIYYFPCHYKQREREREDQREFMLMVNETLGMKGKK